MKRWVIFALLSLAVLMLPQNRQADIGKLRPAQLIYIYKEENKIAVQTDTGDTGSGYTLAKALEDMRRTALGELFLETVDYILVTEQTREELEQQMDFRLSAKVVLVTGMIDVQTAAKYLSVHNPEITLLDYMTRKVQMPKLMTAEERYYLE